MIGQAQNLQTNRLSGFDHGTKVATELVNVVGPLTMNVSVDTPPTSQHWKWLSNQDTVEVVVEMRRETEVVVETQFPFKQHGVANRRAKQRGGLIDSPKCLVGADGPRSRVLSHKGPNGADVMVEPEVIEAHRILVGILDDEHQGNGAVSGDPRGITILFFSRTIGMVDLGAGGF